MRWGSNSKAPSKPSLQAFGVLLVIGVGENLAQRFVAPDPAAVLRRGGAAPGSAARVGDAISGRSNGLHRDDAVPAVAEVVRV